MRTQIWMLVSILLAACALRAKPDAQQFHYRQGGSVENVFFLQSDPSLGWISEDGGRIRYSDDQGLSWIPAEVPETVRGHINGIVFLDSQNGWATGEDGVILSSTNGGQDWTLLNPTNRVKNANNEDASLWDIHMVSSSRGFVVGDEGAFAFTTDGWQTIQQSTGSGITLPAFVAAGFDAYDVHCEPAPAS